MSILLAITHPVWMSIYLIFAMFYWTFRATAYYCRNSTKLAWVFAPIVAIVMLFIYSIGIVCYIYCFVFCYTSVTVYIGICRYYKTPLTRDHNAP